MSLLPKLHVVSRGPRSEEASRPGTVPPPASALQSADAPAAQHRRATDTADGDAVQPALRRGRLMAVGFGAALSYLFALTVFHLQGLAGLDTVLLTAVAIGAAFALFAGLLVGLGGYRLRQEQLAAPMSVCGLLIMLWGMYEAPAAHLIFPPFLFAGLAFGSHRLSRGTTIRLSIAALAGYGAVAWLYSGAHHNAAVLKLQLLHMLVMALALPGFVLLATRMRRLNSALHQASKKIADVQEHARRDHLTGCYNRRYTISLLEQQKAVADATGQPLCLAVLDIDHFKRINDEQGHLTGDRALCLFADIALASTRQTDIVGRYGGEEFLLVLPHTPLLTALNITERLRTQVEQHGWGATLRHGMTVSIGLTQYIPGESVLELFSRADTAMYLAKSGGRNQVVVEEPRAA